LSRRGWLLFVAMGVIWGIPYLLIKVADGGVSVPVLVGTRVAIGSLLLLPAAIRGGHLRALKGHLKWLAAFTAAEIVGPFALLSNAERHLPSSTSGLLIGSPRSAGPAWPSGWPASPCSRARARVRATRYRSFRCC
jgi:drug/metabolite transporter (DMT)-like permease